MWVGTVGFLTDDLKEDKSYTICKTNASLTDTHTYYLHLNPDEVVSYFPTTNKHFNRASNISNVLIIVGRLTDFKIV